MELSVIAEDESTEQPLRGHRTGASGVVHRIDRLASHPAVAVTVLAADLCWVAFSVAVDFSSRWETIFQTLVAALTLCMVFVIQHTQAREQRATQRKLDEILHALPRASNALIAFEEASDAELDTVHEAHRQLRHDAAGVEVPPA